MVTSLADYSMMMHDAFAYAKTGVYERADRWLRLILATILLGIPLTGYLIRIYRGAKPAPEVDNWRSLFIDGLKLVIIGLIYAIPVIIISLVPYVFMATTPVTTHPVGTVVPGDGGMMQSLGLFMLSMLLTLVLEIIIAILLPIASIRFARTRKFSSAFNFREILAYIGKIGWLNYILALILILIVIGVPVFIVEMIFIFGGILAGHMFIGLGLLIALFVLVAPPVVVFQARYMTEVYDLGSETPAVEPGTP
jgi:hypothetical protein